ncbi:ABC transporter ATP-binding protein/permease [Burkholderia gladioli pv. gladioli]|uniref:ABC transporter n=1 Tax=Burkholderia gladioli TaxID=28095 RepID=A0A095G1A1_BURGA|nr:ABC transporter ATP-binding protein/permease [Burkholderia gladioli]AJW99791.1 ABC transporter family protein [Burkholderia gladioli]ASD79989.1 ABC transporter [Burkholderia gladioli pv. gladioli]AWY54764.1 ABC transporter [Burkholderia gladioli pv. gladioli]KGC11152.1 ABC transporter family protein [Burkholderia gladioli]MDJ1164252.1 ABC transporter ATP-binding protein/permease [Burkholderia gladioli pv. gladioli]
MNVSRAFPKDRAEDRDAQRAFPSVWRIILPYWKTGDGLISLIMLAYVLGAGWIGTYFMLWNNSWTGRFYDAIGASKFKLLPQLLTSFLLIAMISAAITMSAVFLQGIVEIRWRRWLTAWLGEQWLTNNTYYGIERDRQLENVDQRIAEDVKLFVNDTLNLVLGLLHVPVSVVSFSIVLWQLGGPVTVPVGSTQYTFHGYLVFAAFLYQGVILSATHLLGRRLITLNAKQQRVEGDFRVMMVRIREFAEQIAFFQGQTQERRRMSDAFRSVVANLYATLWVNTRLSLFTNIVGQVGSVIPTLLVLPQLFAGGMTLGSLMRSNGAFQAVTSALSFFPQVYPGFTSWRAEANRLREFLFVSENLPQTGIALTHGADGAVAAHDLVLRSETSEVLARVPEFTLAPGQRCLVSGRSGCGKSTLLRALAGLWPYGSGRITCGAAGTFFVPQRGYLPTGALKAAMTYPQTMSSFSDSECEDVLRRCGLARYAHALHEEDQWSSRLSGGEQQRIAFARVLLAQPSTIFLDECTSALDAQSEKELYQVLVEHLPRSTIVSVAHRKELLAFHDRTLDFPEPESGKDRHEAICIDPGGLPLDHGR